MNLRCLFPLFLVLLLVSLGGCKAYRDIENLKPKYPEEEKGNDFSLISLKKLVEGDRLSVKLKTGREYHLTYHQLNEENIKGTVSKIDGKKVETPEEIEIPVSLIEEMKVKRYSPGATIGLSIFVGYLITMTIIAILYPPVTI